MARWRITVGPKIWENQPQNPNFGSKHMGESTSKSELLVRKCRRIMEDHRTKWLFSQPGWDRFRLRVPARWLSSMVTCSKKITDPWNLWIWSKNEDPMGWLIWNKYKNVSRILVCNSLQLWERKKKNIKPALLGYRHSGHLRPSFLYGRSFWPRPVRCCRK